MSPSAFGGSAVPMRVQKYVQAVIRTCADGRQELVSVVLFGSAAIGGWVEAVSDVDLILVVPDGATDEDLDRLGREVERIETLHQLRTHSAQGQPALEKLLDRLTANVRSFFICTRSDLLSGNGISGESFACIRRRRFSSTAWCSPTSSPPASRSGGKRYSR